MRAFVVLVAAACVLSSSPASAKDDRVKTEVIEYKHGDVVLQGTLAYRGYYTDKRPGILIVPDWMGPSAFSTDKAEELAENGFVAFVVDVYGKSARPKDKTEAGALAGKFKGDRALLRERMKAAHAVLAKHALVQGKPLAAMGYCFGGTAALELMRAGAPLAAVTSFHGGLDAPLAPAGGIQTKVLVLHGADDPHVKPEEVSGFKDEMRKLKLDWQLVEYSNAVHSFTNPAAGNDNSKGAAYNATADKRSWTAMKSFFGEVLYAK